MSNELRRCGECNAPLGRGMYCPVCGAKNKPKNAVRRADPLKGSLWKRKL